MILRTGHIERVTRVTYINSSNLLRIPRGGTFCTAASTMVAGWQRRPVTTTHIWAATRKSASLEALSSQSGRLFLELREAHGLAYSVWASSQPGIDGGEFIIGLATDPQRVDEARRRCRSVIQDLTRRPFSASEVNRGRAILLGAAAGSLERASGRATNAAWAERFETEAGLDGLLRRLEPVGVKEVAAALQRVADAGWIEVTVHP